jgi:hypothetical protein
VVPDLSCHCNLALDFSYISLAPVTEVVAASAEIVPPTSSLRHRRGSSVKFPEPDEHSSDAAQDHVPDVEVPDAETFISTYERHSRILRVIEPK